MNGRVGLDQGFEPGILFRGPFVVAVSGHGNSPCSLARQHNSNIPRCQNCQGAEKTDGNSQEQAAVLCHLPFAFGRSTRSSRNSSGPLVSRVGALLGRGDFLLQIIIFGRLSVVFEKNKSEKSEHDQNGPGYHQPMRIFHHRKLAGEAAKTVT
jgi:hypothetical protein